MSAWAAVAAAGGVIVTMTPAVPRTTAAIPPRRLLLSIHDVSPRHESEIDELHDRLAASGGDRLAMLVVPNFWGVAPIVAGSPFAARLRRWADSGIEIFLHGFSHRDDAVHDNWRARLKATQMTAGEGEFLGLDKEQALARMAQGRALLEDVTGRPVAGFIAPAWLYGEGALRALAEMRLPLAEDHWKVWTPATGATLARSPVITWATRTPARALSSLFVARLARSLPLPRVMRVGVHPGDVTRASTLRSITRTVAKIAQTHAPSRYRDLLGDTACVS
jgi:predicted deacetylase